VLTQEGSGLTRITAQTTVFPNLSAWIFNAKRKSSTSSPAPFVRQGQVESFVGGHERFLKPEDPGRMIMLLRTGAAAKCSSQNASRRPLPTAITFTGSAKTFSDRVATGYGPEGHVL
jgi:hypothetical protein